MLRLILFKAHALGSDLSLLLAPVSLGFWRAGDDADFAARISGSASIAAISASNRSSSELTWSWLNTERAWRSDGA